jgi:hypothetical protein
MAQPISTFLVQYDITTGLPGAPTLHLELVVNTVRKSVTGTGSITQAINPPPDFESVVVGDFTYMTVMPRNTHILLTLTGHEHVSPITPIVIPNLHVRAVLDESWSNGTATFRYLMDGRWHEVEHAKVTKAPHFVPLYAAPLTDAVASGDLARMKSLAAQAEQQLAQAPAIQTALTALKAEIAKIDNR